MQVTNWMLRLVRRYRFDDNPLRRRSDRIESAMVVGALVVLLLGVWPALILGQGDRGTVPVGPDDGRYLVTAVVEEAAAPSGGVSRGPLPKARARWIAPDGSARTGMVSAPAGVGIGAAFDLWIDDQGRPATPSPEPSGPPFTVTFAAAEYVLATAALLFAGFVGLRRCFLDRRRYREWDAAWAAANERWRRSRPS